MMTPLILLYTLVMSLLYSCLTIYIFFDLLEYSMIGLICNIYILKTSTQLQVYFIFLPSYLKCKFLFQLMGLISTRYTL